MYMGKERKSNAGKIIVALLLTGILAGGFWVWSNRDKVAGEVKPEVLLSNVEVKDIDSDTIRMVAHVVVVNNSPLRITTDRLDYEIFIDGTPVVSGRMDRKLEIAKDDTTTVSVPLTVALDKLAPVMARFKQDNTDSATYRIKASFRTKVPVAGMQAIALDRKYELPAFRFMNFKPVDLHLDKFSLSEPEFTVDLRIDNPNDFPFRMKDVYYTMKMGDAARVDGSIRGLTTVPPNQSVTVPCEVDVRKMNLPKAVWKTLFKKDETEFNVWVKSTVVSSNEMINNSTMAFHAEGTLAELKALKKKD